MITRKRRHSHSDHSDAPRSSKKTKETAVTRSPTSNRHCEIILEDEDKRKVLLLANEPDIVENSSVRHKMTLRSTARPDNSASTEAASELTPRSMAEHSACCRSHEISCSEVAIHVAKETFATSQPFPFTTLLPELKQLILGMLSKKELLLLRFTSHEVRELVDAHAPFMYVPMAGMLAILQMKSISKYQQLSNLDLIKSASKYFNKRRFPGKMGFQLNELGPFDARSAKAIPSNLYLLRINLCKLDEGVLFYLPRNLHSLILNNCSVKNHDLEFLPPNLKRLALGECKEITDEAIRNLPRGIQRLTLSACEKLTNAAIKGLPPHVQVLEFTGSKAITDEGLAYLPSTLQRLSITSCSNVTARGFKNLPKGVEYLDLIHTGARLGEDFKNLPESVCEMRFCSCNMITKTTVQYIPKNVLRLSLIHCTDLSVELLRNLPPNLDFLSLYGCGSDELLEALPRNLAELDLSECSRITDSGVKNLPATLKKLYMRHTPITDEGLSNLPCKNLEELDIGSCNVTDGGLRFLPSSLIYVNLWGINNISPKGVQQFHQRLRYCSTNVAYAIMKELLAEKFGS
eukprot:TRINITY_DN6597_c0_g2_i1.p1 TRINITY_DN6597_c0_g2~~TRINITY_DN6597_c0_g2_i1.p1  ORF type:complete len:575 (-),score=128.27 TRINITY_DN6597_c0_g2_i1:11-1735(-)